MVDVEIVRAAAAIVAVRPAITEENIRAGCSGEQIGDVIAIAEINGGSVSEGQVVNIGIGSRIRVKKRKRMQRGLDRIRALPARFPDFYRGALDDICIVAEAAGQRSVQRAAGDRIVARAAVKGDTLKIDESRAVSEGLRDR
jgi:hypothetical protein